MKGEGNSAIFQKKTFLPIFVPSEKDRGHHPLGKRIDFCLPTLYYPPVKEIVENMEVWDFGGLTRTSGAGKFSKEREYCYP